MTTITLKRTKSRRTNKHSSETGRTFRELAGSYRGAEKTMEFAIEAVLFAIIVGISVWPAFAAAGALTEFLQQATV